MDTKMENWNPMEYLQYRKKNVLPDSGNRFVFC